MEWGLSTHLFAYQTLDEGLLELIRSLGVTKIELWGMRPHFDYEKPDVVRQLAHAAKRQGIVINSVHAPFYTHVNELHQGNTLSLATLDAKVREGALVHTNKVLDIMGVLGAKLLVAHAGDLKDDYSKDKLNNLRRSLEQLLPRLQEQGVRLALENIATPLSTTTRLLELLNSFNSDYLGICLDIGHARLNEDVKQAILGSGSKIMGVHVSDNDGVSDLHRIPGEGVIDWQRTINLLQKVRYKGVLNLELRQHEGLLTTLEKIKKGIKCHFNLNFFPNREKRR